MTSPRLLTPPRRVPGARRPGGPLAHARGPWRVAVAEASMLPTIRPGDWLLVDPTTGRWPRRGSIVVFKEPEGGLLAIKRVAGRPGDWVPFADGWLQLGHDEAWLLSDAADAERSGPADRDLPAGGAPIDSRRYGPVPVTALVGRAWLRYWPPSRIGLLGRRPGSTTAARSDAGTDAPEGASPP